MKISYILGAFSVICFVFALIYSSDISDVKSKTLTGDGGEYGPLIVKEKNASYEITISNYVQLNKWSYIEVEVLDENKQHLFSFGDGMWHESGYDDEGAWEESKTKYSMDVTFKEPGKYYLKIVSERNDGPGNPIVISTVQERGSNVAFTVLGVISLLLAGIAYYAEMHSTLDERANKKSKIVLVIILIVFFMWALFYSMRGWGYMGYNGYSHGPSFFYFGGPGIFHSPSNRDGSISGSGHRGGGFGVGK